MPGAELGVEDQVHGAVSSPVLVVSLQSLRLELAEDHRALLGGAESNVRQAVKCLALTLVEL